LRRQGSETTPVDAAAADSDGTNTPVATVKAGGDGKKEKEISNHHLRHKQDTNVRSETKKKEFKGLRPTSATKV
jgi:hypothetical protein